MTSNDQNTTGGIDPEALLDEAARLSAQVQALDKRRDETVARRAIVLQQGLDAGMTSRDFAARLKVTSPRVFHMIKQGQRQAERRARA